jgi:hypothetical protein
MGLDDIASRIADANHGMVRTAEKLGVADSIADESIFTVLYARRDPRGRERL